MVWSGCAWVYVGSGLFERLNVFMLMSLPGQPSTPCMVLSNLQPEDCKTGERHRGGPKKYMHAHTASGYEQLKEGKQCGYE